MKGFEIECDLLPRTWDLLLLHRTCDTLNRVKAYLGGFLLEIKIKSNQIKSICLIVSPLLLDFVQLR